MFTTTTTPPTRPSLSLPPLETTSSCPGSPSSTYSTDLSPITPGSPISDCSSSASSSAGSDDSGTTADSLELITPPSSPSPSPSPDHNHAHARTRGHVRLPSADSVYSTTSAGGVDLDLEVAVELAAPTAGAKTRPDDWRRRQSIDRPVSPTAHLRPVRAQAGRPRIFIGVRIGRRPGIYTSRHEAERQLVNEHSRLRSFSTLFAAEAYLRGWWGRDRHSLPRGAPYPLLEYLAMTNPARHPLPSGNGKRGSYHAKLLSTSTMGSSSSSNDMTGEFGQHGLLHPSLAASSDELRLRGSASASTLRPASGGAGYAASRNSWRASMVHISSPLRQQVATPDEAAKAQAQALARVKFVAGTRGDAERYPDAEQREVGRADDESGKGKNRSKRSTFLSFVGLGIKKAPTPNGSEDPTAPSAPVATSSASSSRPIAASASAPSVPIIVTRAPSLRKAPSQPNMPVARPGARPVQAGAGTRSPRGDPTRLQPASPRRKPPPSMWDISPPSPLSPASSPSASSAPSSSRSPATSTSSAPRSPRASPAAVSPAAATLRHNPFQTAEIDRFTAESFAAKSSAPSFSRNALRKPGVIMPVSAPRAGGARPPSRTPSLPSLTPTSSISSVTSAASSVGQGGVMASVTPSGAGSVSGTFSRFSLPRLPSLDRLGHAPGRSTDNGNGNAGVGAQQRQLGGPIDLAPPQAGFMRPAARGSISSIASADSVYSNSSDPDLPPSGYQAHLPSHGSISSLASVGSTTSTLSPPTPPRLDKHRSAPYLRVVKADAPHGGPVQSDDSNDDDIEIIRPESHLAEMGYGIAQLDLQYRTVPGARYGAHGDIGDVQGKAEMMRKYHAAGQGGAGLAEAKKKGAIGTLGKVFGMKRRA